MVVVVAPRGWGWRYCWGEGWGEVVVGEREEGGVAGRMTKSEGSASEGSELEEESESSSMRACWDIVGGWSVWGGIWRRRNWSVCCSAFRPWHHSSPRPDLVATPLTILFSISEICYIPF